MITTGGGISIAHAASLFVGRHPAAPPPPLVISRRRAVAGAGLEAAVHRPG